MRGSELIRRCTLDRAGIMFVTDLIRDMRTSLKLLLNVIAPETTITTLKYLATGKYYYAAEMIWVWYSTCYVTVHFL